MGEGSKIEWTDHTFNPWVGCTKISPGCDHCYAEGWAKRSGHPDLWSGSRRRTTPANWRQPLKWNAEAARTGVRARVFCASLADVFDNDVPWGWRADLLDLIRRCGNLDFLVLSKRIGNVLPMLREITAHLGDEHDAQAERDRGLQAGSCRRTRDRFRGEGLAGSEANSRSLEGRHEGDALPASPCGAEDGLRLPSSARNDRRGASLRSGPSPGMAAFQRSDSPGTDGESSGWREGQEPSDQPGAGDVQRAEAARDQRVGSATPRRKGISESEGTGFGDGCDFNAATAGAGLAGERHRGTLRDYPGSGLPHLPRQDVAARDDLLAWIEAWINRAPPANVWLGITVVNQEEADRDVPKLLATPAHVRFLSCEPLLTPINLASLTASTDRGSLYGFNCLSPVYPWGTLNYPLVDWVIVGGESGPGARPFTLGWGKDIVRQCREAGVPVFVKQLGANPVNREGERCPHIRDRKGKVMEEWPEKLRVRQLPKVRECAS